MTIPKVKIWLNSIWMYIKFLFGFEVFLSLEITAVIARPHLRVLHPFLHLPRLVPAELLPLLPCRQSFLGETVHSPYDGVISAAIMQIPAKAKSFCKISHHCHSLSRFQLLNVKTIFHVLLCWLDSCWIVLVNREQIRTNSIVLNFGAQLLPYHLCPWNEWPQIGVTPVALT